MGGCSFSMNAFEFLVTNFDIDEVEEITVESITKFVTPEVFK